MKPSFLARNLTIIIAILLIFSDVFGFGHMVTESNVPEIKAIRINGDRPNIDGALDDPVWQRKDIDFAREFIQREPDEGQPATESTSVAIAYDDDAIYFAFWCYDREPDKIMYQLIRRDNLGAADAVTVRLDPYHDHQTGARFDVTSSGSRAKPVSTTIQISITPGCCLGIGGKEAALGLVGGDSHSFSLSPIRRKR
jgi:hypothetical protein